MLELAANDVRLLLDENISPRIVPQLWENGVDAVSLRDRSRLRSTDYQVMAYAQKDGRAIATINEAHFERIAASMKTHAGVISLPSGGSRNEQFDYIMAAVNQLRALGNAMAGAKDHVLTVEDDRRVGRRLVIKSTAPAIALVAKPSA